MSIGIPIKLLHEAQGHIVTVETTSGELYRGHLANAEDSMNCHLSGVTLTKKDGQVHALEQAFIRGSKIRFIVVPDILKKAPMFKMADPSKAVTRGRGLGYGTGRGRGRASRCMSIQCDAMLQFDNNYSPLLSLSLSH